MEPTHRIVVEYDVTVPDELAADMDQVETNVDDWLSNVDPIGCYDEDDEEQEVTLTHRHTAWTSL
jgi:hypothetical protein